MDGPSGEDNDVQTPAVMRPRRQGRWIGWVLVFFSCVLLLDGLLGEHGLARTIEARKERRMATESVEQLKQENAALRDQARRLQEDAATLESLARRELGLIRRGEILVVVKDRE